MSLRPLLAILVALSVVVGATGIAAADTSLSVTAVSLPDSVSQGDSFDLTVSVSGEEIQNDEVDVSLTLPDGLSCSPTGTQTVTLSGGTAQATFDCDADVEGDYSGEITVSASGVSSGSDPDPSQSTQAGLEVISPASLTLSTSLDSSSIDESKSTTLTTVVHNSGDASTGYSLSLSSGSGYSRSISSGAASGTVSGGATETVEYSVTGDSSGDYSLTASLSGGNGQSISKSESLSVASTSSNDGDGGGGGGGGSSATVTATATATATETATATDSAGGTATSDDDGTTTESNSRTEMAETTEQETTTMAATTAPTETEQSGTTAAETTAGSGPGFGVGLAVVALLAVALLARRRG